MMVETRIGYGKEMNCVVLRMIQYLEEYKHQEGAVHLWAGEAKKVCVVDAGMKNYSIIVNFKNSLCYHL